MTAPVMIAASAEIDEIDAEAIELAVADVMLRQFAARAQRIALRVLLTAVGTLATACALAQLVKWIG